MRKTDGTILEATNRRNWLHLEMELLRQKGKYEQTLEKLEELYSYESFRGVDIEALRTNHLRTGLYWKTIKTSQIHFTLPKQSQVSLVGYDMLGREVARLVDDLDIPDDTAPPESGVKNTAGVLTFRLMLTPL